MSLNSTPSSERVHIGFFGVTNAGKSSIVNALTNQEMAMVSNIAGTTTDPVSKAMEILPIGPCVIVDTPGLSDESELGQKRIKKTYQVLNLIDAACLCIDAQIGKTENDTRLINAFLEKKIPFLIAYNKADITDKKYDDGIMVSAKTGKNIEELKIALSKILKTEEKNTKIIGDLLMPEDVCVLCIPIDESAPKGRLILPQQQVIRDILDSNALAITTKPETLDATLKKLCAPPKIVITDSQAFSEVSKIVPESIPLTSFSVLMARYKGFLKTAVEGARAIENLKDGDTILMGEGCTHHRQCNDIGSVKLPNLIKKYTKKDVNFEYSSGKGFPEYLSKYSLVIHCGGCMLTEREVLYRQKCTLDSEIPFTNYGTAIAYMNGILERSIKMFPNL